jgi:tetratricopeptide (TPR) repeat protein
VFQDRLGDAGRAAAILELVPPDEADDGPPTPAPSSAPPAPPAPAAEPPPSAGPARSAENAPASLPAPALDDLIAAGRWNEAVATLLATASEEEGKARASYLFAAAKILQHELADGDGASALLNQALDLDPANTKLIEALYRLRANRKEWPAAEADLVRMIGRLQARAGSERMQAALWRRLGDLYRVALRDHAGASEAYGRALDLDPTDQRCRHLLEQLAGAGA